MKNIYKP